MITSTRMMKELLRPGFPHSLSAKRTKARRLALLQQVEPVSGDNLALATAIAPWLTGRYDQDVAAEAVKALARLRGDAIPSLGIALESTDPTVVANAVWAVAMIGPAAGELGPALFKLIGKPGPSTIGLADAFRSIGPASAPAVPFLVGLLSHVKDPAAALALKALISIGPAAAPVAVTAVVRASLNRSTASDAKVAIQTLGISAEHVADVLQDILVNPVRRTPLNLHAIYRLEGKPLTDMAAEKENSELRRIAGQELVRLNAGRADLLVRALAASFEERTDWDLGIVPGLVRLLADRGLPSVADITVLIRTLERMDDGEPNWQGSTRHPAYGERLREDWAIRAIVALGPVALPALTQERGNRFYTVREVIGKAIARLSGEPGDEKGRP